MKLQAYIPSIEWLGNYKKANLRGDLSAGLTVGVMLIPQGMAYAMIAGLPPIYGLYASTIPLLLYALLGTSRQLAVGPVAMVSLLTAAGIGTMAEGGTETYIALAITLAFLVGAIQFLLGVFRLGFLVNFLSHPVISGFTSAAALIIGLSQLKHLLGVPIPRSHHIHEILINAFQQIDSIHWGTVAIGIIGILLIKGTKKVNRTIPSTLVAVIFAILAVWSFDLAAKGVQIVGTIPEGLPKICVPNLDAQTMQRLFPIALTIALVSFMESIAVAKAIQNKHKNYRISPNQELIALGMANVGGAFFQSYPTTGGFSRTAVNDQAGARTGLASIISAALVALTLLFLTPLFYHLPKAILASIVMVAVANLIDIKEAKHLWHSNRTDFWMLAATFVATLSLGIELGIAVGVALSLIMVIYRSSRPHVAVLGHIPNTSFYRNVNRFDGLEDDPSMAIIRFDSELYFANTTHFREVIEAQIETKKETLKTIILNAECISYMDSSAIHVLEDIHEDCQQKGIQLLLTGVRGPVRDALTQTHLVDKIGKEHFFMNVHRAVGWVKDNTKEDTFDKYLLQTEHS